MRIIIAIIAFLSVATSLEAQSNDSSRTILQPDSIQHDRLVKAINYIYIDSFQAGYNCLDSIITRDPGYWPAYVFKIGIIYTEMKDNESYDQVDYFKDLIDSTLNGLDNFLKRYPDDKWALFFKGSTAGYLALYEGHHGSWVKAVFKGLEAGKLFSKAVEADSTFYDAYLGLGNLNYWKSAKMGFFRSLPFIPDNRDEGIAQITLAMDSSQYSSLPAASGLAWIHYNRKEYDKTIELMANLEKQGIHGRQILWPKGLAYFKTSNAGGTIETFTRIKESLERKGNQNYYNIGLCDYYIGLAYYWRGDYTAALKHLNDLLNREVDSEIAKRLKDKYKSAENYKKKIKKAVAKKTVK
jgi:tetratricopeptide (TPR) repeat protein